MAPHKGKKLLDRPAVGLKCGGGGVNGRCRKPQGSCQWCRGAAEHNQVGGTPHSLLVGGVEHELQVRNESRPGRERNAGKGAAQQRNNHLVINFGLPIGVAVVGGGTANGEAVSLCHGVEGTFEFCAIVAPHRSRHPKDRD